MFNEEDFEQIRPYYDHEIKDALKRITASPVFGKVLAYLLPDEDENEIKGTLEKISTALEFQKAFMYPLVANVIKNSSDGLTSEGFDHITPGKPYVFLANHRDIVLDSAFLQLMLVEKGCETSEITFGSNLMTNQFIIDLGKVNRMFVVNRGGNGRELFMNAQLLSEYIRHTITEKKVSVWIAQRRGRTKDGNDKTEPGLLKMFNISGSHDFKESFRELNIVPLIISYEYEPCCALKIKELSITSRGIPYMKPPNEDIVSIITGIKQNKGKIHFAVGRPLKYFLDEAGEMGTNNEKISKLTELADAEIFRNYRLWPNNYIAYDMLYKTNNHARHYSKTDMERFMEYMNSELSGLDIDNAVKKELFLKIYSNPVINVHRHRHLVKS